MSVYQQINEKINHLIKVEKLQIIDDSLKHKGHAGYKEGGESHFNLLVVSNDFDGLNRVKRHKLIYSALDDLMKDKIHALAIKAYTPEEYEEL